VAQGLGPEFKPQYCQKKKKRMKIMSFVGKWKELEIIIISKIT
jgi:hypothetical protein